jgi:hypothetical protein
MDAVDGVISDALQEVAQVKLRIKTVELRRSCRTPDYAEAEVSLSLDHVPDLSNSCKAGSPNEGEGE